MELTIGDLVRHVHHDALGYGIVISKTTLYKGLRVCSVEWVTSGRRHFFDIDYLILIKGEEGSA